jgi:hypothetical protein
MGCLQVGHFLTLFGFGFDTPLLDAGAASFRTLFFFRGGGVAGANGGATSLSTTTTVGVSSVTVSSVDGGGGGGGGGTISRVCVLVCSIVTGTFGVIAAFEIYANIFLIVFFYCFKINK